MTHRCRKEVSRARWLSAHFVAWAAASILAAPALGGQAQSADPLSGITALVVAGKLSEARAVAKGALDDSVRTGDRQGEAVALFLLANVEGAAGDLTAASSDLERGAAVFEARADPFGSWVVLETLAEVEVRRGKLDTALAVQRRALALLQRAEAPDQLLSVASFKHLSQVLGLPTAALDMISTQPEIFKPYLLDLAEATTRTSYGENLMKSGGLEEAEASLARAMELSGRLGGFLDLRLAAGLGELRRRQGRLEEARDSYRRVVEGAASATKVRESETLALQSLGELEDLEMLRGRVDDALLWNDQVLALARRRGDPILEISSLRNRGRLLADGARFEAARATMTRASEMALKAGHILLQGLIEMDRGSLALQEKRYGEAVLHFEKAVSLLHDFGVPQGEAAALNQLAGAYLMVGSSENARATLEKAGELARKSGFQRAEEGSELLAALVRFMEKPADSSEVERLLAPLASSPDPGVSWTDSLICVSAAADLAGNRPARPSPAGEPRAGAEISGPPGFHTYVLGLRHFQRGEIAAARELWQTALTQAPAGERDADLLYLIGETFLKEGRQDDAIPYLKRAIDALELNAEKVGVDELIGAYLGSHRQGYFQALVGILIQRGSYEEAFDYTERARTRALLMLLGNRRLRPELGGDANLAEQTEVLRSLIARWERESLFASQPEQVKLSADLAQARRQFESLRVRLKASNPQYGSLTAASPLTSKAVRDELPADTTLISYFVAFDRIHAWVLDRESSRYVSLGVGPQALHRAVCWARELGPGPGSRGVSRLDPSCGDEVARAEDVYDELFAPLRSRIRHRRLIVVPHGDLHYLPFAALRDRRTGRYLIEDYTLTYAPSASALSYLRRKETPFAGRALVLGAPEERDPRLEPLPAARREAEVVGLLLDAPVLTGRQATETRLYQLGGKVDLLHIAAHAVFEPRSPLFSRVVLAPDEKHDGNLEVQEILSTLDLSGVNLVVLSACETARGERGGGDEIAGLTQAILYAGSPGVISTLWKIDDTATEPLMRELYRSLVGGAPVADALRQAQVRLLHTPVYSNPRFWAAFGLTGDPRGRWKAPVPVKVRPTRAEPEANGSP